MTIGAVRFELATTEMLENPVKSPTPTPVLAGVRTLDKPSEDPLDLPMAEEICPWEMANVYSEWTYAWTQPLMRTARRRLLNLGDLGKTPTTLATEKLTADYERFWKLKIEHGWSWPRLIFNFQKKSMIVSAIQQLISDGVSWCLPALSRLLMAQLKSREDGTLDSSLEWTLYAIAGTFFLITVVRTLFENISGFISINVGLQIRSALMGQLYKKSLKFSHASRQAFAGGAALNILSVDTNRVYFHLLLVNNYWLIPFRLIVAYVLCIYYLGWAALPGLVFLLLLIPIMFLIASRIKHYRVEYSRASDARLLATQEYLQGIKVLKYLGLEDIALKRIKSLRKVELDYCRKSNMVYAFSMALNFWAPIFASTISIGTSAILQGHLEADSVIASILTFQALIQPLKNIPAVVSSLIVAKTSLRRISDFLSLPEVTEAHNVIKDADSPIDNGKGVGLKTVVSIKDADLVWEASPPTFRRQKKKRRKTLELPEGTFSTVHSTTAEGFKLRDINVKIKEGALVAIMGPIGAGKTSLLEAIMGDLKLEKGSIQLETPSIGYCEQNAWIRNATVRDNIVFGRPFDELLYRRVIEECCLEKDLELLPFGDETMIGEKGATISGGQKQRIGIARVFYAQPELVLFDDPFSAVDATVARNLFYSIKDGLLAGKTRIIATHNRSILDEVDLIIVMDKGRVKVVGTYDEIRNSVDPRLAGIREILIHAPLYEDDSESESESSSDEEAEADTISIKKGKDKVAADLDTHIASSSSSSSDEEEDDATLEAISIEVKKRIKASADAALKRRNRSGAGGKRRTDEKIAKKASPESVKAYIDGFGGTKAVILVLSLIFFTEMARVGKDLFMKAELKDGAGDPTTFMTIFTSIGLLQGFLSAIANVLAVVFCARASWFIHEVCIDRVMSARLAVFDVTPIGRILTRFGRDLEAIDNSFSEKLTFLVTSLSIVFSALLLMMWITPGFAVTFIVPIMMTWAIQQKFGCIWRQVTQLNGQALGPIVAHFSETLAGLTTIRALSGGQFFTSIFYSLCDDYIKSNLWLNAVRRWMCIRSEIVGNAYILLMMWMCIYLSTPYAIVGIVLAYLVNAADSVDWSLKNLAEVQSCMVSVERLYKYIMDMASENGDNSAPSTQLTDVAVNYMPPPQWPSEGRIEFSMVTLTYREDLPPALKDLLLTIEPKEKLAIVGRTGAGKSSIISCLYRFVELSKGKIIIDGVDISKISLSRLRKSLAMVPQDPLLFSGSLRRNLDPEGKCTDDQIWYALECTFMKEIIQAFPDRLEMDVGERGGTFSIGQRQLLCLARAMLRFSTIVILDEATSSIDRDTDALIQSSLLQNFSNCTVVTIAHRLETIMNYDRVAVMAEGRILEIGNPKELARTDGTEFNDMVLTAGIDIDAL